jgi:hypothetical protein
MNWWLFFKLIIFSQQLFGESDKDEDNDEEKDENNKTIHLSLFETVFEYKSKWASTHQIVNIQGDTSIGEEEHEITKFPVNKKQK